MIETVYKLTRPDRTTYNGFQYDVGKEYVFSGTGPLCSAGYSHAYLSPETAVLHNPIHANYKPAILWEADGVIAARDGQMKVGCRSIVLVKQLPLPQITTDQCVAYGIRCAWSVGRRNPSWRMWAIRWLSGADRSLAAGAAEAAAARGAWAAWVATRAAAAPRAVVAGAILGMAAAEAAAKAAAEAAAKAAAEAAAKAALAVAAGAAEAAAARGAWAAWVATRAAAAAAEAAQAAAVEGAGFTLNLVEIATWAAASSHSPFSWEGMEDGTEP